MMNLDLRHLYTRVDRVGRVARSIAIQRRAKLPPLQLLDIGALFGLQERWEVLRKLGIVKPVLCDPDHAEAERLRSAYPGALVLECALGAEEGDATLHMARDQGKSSLLRPNLERISSFEPVGPWEIVREVPIKVKPLDTAIKGMAPPDFMKIDVQGYELEVLKGAVKTLPSVLAVEVETSVVPLYHGQPTHSDITEWFLDHGFRPVATKTTGTFGGEGVQAVEYDAFFANEALVASKPDALNIWLTTNRIRRGGSWDLY